MYRLLFKVNSQRFISLVNLALKLLTAKLFLMKRCFLKTTFYCEPLSFVHDFSVKAVKVTGWLLLTPVTLPPLMHKTWQRKI